MIFKQISKDQIKQKLHDQFVFSELLASIDTAKFIYYQKNSKFDSYIVLGQEYYLYATVKEGYSYILKHFKFIPNIAIKYVLPTEIKKDQNFNTSKEFLSIKNIKVSESFNYSGQIKNLEFGKIDHYIEQLCKCTSLNKSKLRNIIGIKVKLSDIYILEIDGQIIAGVSIVEQFLNQVVIGGVFTIPNFQRRGHSFNLLKHVILKYLELNYLVTLYAQTPEAKKMYQKLGFKSHGYIHKIMPPS